MLQGSSDNGAVFAAEGRSTGWRLLAGLTVQRQESVISGRVFQRRRRMAGGGPSRARQPACTTLNVKSVSRTGLANVAPLPSTIVTA